MKKRAEIVNEICAAIEQDRRGVAELAQRAGVAEPTIYHWLSGYTVNPNIDTLVKVAGALGRRVAFLDGAWALVPITLPASNGGAKMNKRPRMALWRYQRA
jgi:transcriptional regulator with XRE-family HTH domain